MRIYNKVTVHCLWNITSENVLYTDAKNCVLLKESTMDYPLCALKESLEISLNLEASSLTYCFP